MSHKAFDIGGGKTAIRAASGSMTIHEDFQFIFLSPMSVLLLRDVINATDIECPPKVPAYHWLGADAELV